MDPKKMLELEEELRLEMEMLRKDDPPKDPARLRIVSDALCECYVARIQEAQKTASPGRWPKVPASQVSRMRLFVLERSEDVSGMSGTGIVAEGVVFSNGEVAFSWISPLATVTMCHSVDVLERLHGHEGRTRVRFL